MSTLTGDTPVTDALIPHDRHRITTKDVIAAYAAAGIGAGLLGVALLIGAALS